MKLKKGIWISLVGLLLVGSLSYLAAQMQTKAFQQALPGYTFVFPGDHAAHPDYKTEWWYYTGHLKAEDGREFGYELTFFRSALDSEGLPKASDWSLKEMYPAHFAVSDIGKRRFFYTEKLNRGAAGIAGARTDVYSVWNELWFAELLGKTHMLRADSPDYSIHLTLTPEKPPVVHGRDGVSQKSDCVGCASHYYSLTRLKTDGVLYVDGKPVVVSGQSWMDHEFGSNQLSKNQVGWDWFSIQLADGTELMLYLIRQQDGRPDANSSGTWVGADGRSVHLSQKDFTVTPLSRWKSPNSPGTYPMGWRVSVPSKGVALTLTPAFEGQELVTRQSTGITYWEGATRVSGQSGDKPVGGEAYVEMTGYAQAFRQKI